MKNKILAVKKFHKAFKLDYLESPKADLGSGAPEQTLGQEVRHDRNERHV